MRTAILVAISLVIGAARSHADSSAEQRFATDIRPLIERHCVSCHGGPKPEGDLNLARFTTAEHVAKNLPQWELVLERLEARTMPPADAKSQPSDAARRRSRRGPRPPTQQCRV